ncbi:hypothetical protein S1OALGB6SA_732 [Olavius algarvensis spirochete endosymbiont]|uniref:hypothetical protein n=1 Tax=Olavius algarvensis spirochete endosymbiont TaxID=260710 RepID=UPI00052C1D44|nr:hypothetical protein [Olavius algarvensis spirochete endosymbiont]KGM43196.1 hypothetical protein JY97_08825 [Alkalispirochaeta odontotermitis]VDA99661.1 hypothetical protein S1OALGB6SA_732 [Olavius algarvensis spirochete endosymbiont]
MKTLIINILAIVPVLGWGQTFEKTVDFNIDLSSLSSAEVVREVVNDGRVIIIEGLLRDITVEETNEETILWITLIGGEWIGTSEVRAYTCRVQVRGDQEAFTGIAQESPGHIVPGNRMLVAARVMGINTEDQVAELEMVDYRVFE